jgi:hypothetical protein
MAAARSNARPASLAGGTLVLAFAVRECLCGVGKRAVLCAYSAFAFGMRLLLGCKGLQHSHISLSFPRIS